MLRGLFSNTVLHNQPNKPHTTEGGLVEQAFEVLEEERCGEFWEHSSREGGGGEETLLFRV